ncbi:MAG TPA: phosphoribosylaminoimidazolesuccinocarboxamide synthase [Bacteroidia bacterium]|nr:phosphoribosylaminoimidazolesuccinocarboxamide synthase [Bacteroidia bacterium]
MTALYDLRFKFQNQTRYYKGKVRDVYTIADKYLVMVVSDRISAFDVVLPKPIPFKGQVLNQVAEHFLKATGKTVPNWFIHAPHPNVSVGYLCQPFKVEMVVRNYLAGHAWRVYKEGGRVLCGVKLPDGLKENDVLPNPIITPSTKADHGHDEDISEAEIVQQGLVPEHYYEQMRHYALDLFHIGTQMAIERGLLLVDTKYEFGLLNNEVVLMDEVHTPDSSRYFYADGYEQRQSAGETQKQLSKEFVRQWLIENGFMGRENESVPEMSNEWINTISQRYIELYESITGMAFQKSTDSNNILEIEKQVNEYLLQLSLDQ